MRLPATLDPRRLRGGRATDDDADEYEYVDADDFDLDGTAELGDGWEWVEVDDPEDQPTVDAAGPAGGRRSRRFGRLVATLLPLGEHVGDEVDPLAASDEDESDEADELEGAGDVVAESEPPRRGGRSRRASRRSSSVVDPPRFDGAEDHGADDHVDDGYALDGYALDGYDDVDGDDLEPDLEGAIAVDPRIAARRDGVANARRARLRRRLIALAVVVGLVATLGALTRSGALDVDQVVVSGTERATADEIAAASGITPGTPLLELDLEQAAAKVRAEPWVLDASVDRTWSGTITVSVVERVPVVTMNAGDLGWLLIDGDRRVVAASDQPPPLPIVDGVGIAAVGDELAPEAQAALDVAVALTPGLRTRVAVVDGTDPDDVALTLQPTGTVRFGPATQIEERIGSLQAVFAQVDLLCLDRIDLGVPDAPVLTRVPACA